VSEITEETIWTKEGRITGGWRKSHEQFHHFYSSQNFMRVFKSRTVRLAECVARISYTRNVYKILFRGHERKGPLAICGRRWEDNIVMGLKEIGWEGADLIHVVQEGLVVDRCEHCYEPSVSIQGGKFLH
jgi:hypothetical protein